MASPKYQPADHLYPWELSDGVRNTIPLTVLEGWQRPDEDRTFEMRQTTIAERCSAFRLAMEEGELDDRERMRIGTRKSTMALAQTDEIARQLHQAFPRLAVEIVRFDTRGDDDQVAPH